MTAKVRPCLVVSTTIGDADRALVCMVPHTTSTRGSAFEAVTATPFPKQGAFDAQGLVTVGVRHVIRLLGTLSRDQMAMVEYAICTWLELPCSR